MRIIISDTNALIDLRKVALLEALLRLPYEVQVPDLLRGRATEPVGE